MIVPPFTFQKHRYTMRVVDRLFVCLLYSRYPFEGGSFGGFGQISIY